MLAEILAVPPFIESALEILRAIKGSVRNSERPPIQELEKKLHQIGKGLSHFSESRIEVQAWKEVHHITNQIQIGLTRTFLAASQGRGPFTAKLDEHEKKDIILEVKSLKKLGAPINRIRLLLSKPEIVSVIVLPRSIYDSDIGWCESFLTTFSNLERHLEEGNMGSAYNALEPIPELVININSYADDRLQKNITEFVEVMEKLSNHLANLDLTKD